MKLLKPLWITAGIICLGLGCIGIPLPVLPTTPFFLCAAFCFAKGSKRLDSWFKNSKIYKKHLESFVINRAMTLKTKFCILIPASLMLLLAFAGMSHKNTTGTIIGRFFIVFMFITKYLYFFTRIRTIPCSEANINQKETENEKHICRRKKTERTENSFTDDPYVLQKKT